MNQLLWQVWPEWLSEVHPPRHWAGQVARQLLPEVVGRLLWPLSQAAKPVEGGLGWGYRRAQHTTWFTADPCQSPVGNPASPGPKSGQGNWPDLGLGLKPHVLNPTWEILAISW